MEGTVRWAVKTCPAVNRRLTAGARRAAAGPGRTHVSTNGATAHRLHVQPVRSLGASPSPRSRKERSNGWGMEAHFVADLLCTVRPGMRELGRTRPGLARRGTA